MLVVDVCCLFFFFKPKTAYEMRISDWSSDVCSSDLSIEALEQVRLLTNLETDTQKLLQVILIGQPELRELLARDDLRQLAQRITARFHLVPLDEAGSERYLRHRHPVAGGPRLPFDKAALRPLPRHPAGVPPLQIGSASWRERGGPYG